MFKFDTTFDDNFAEIGNIENEFKNRLQDIKKNRANSAIYVISFRKSEEI